MNQLPDQRSEERQSPAEAFLIEAHAARARHLLVELDMIVVRSLAREHTDSPA